MRNQIGRWEESQDILEQGSLTPDGFDGRRKKHKKEKKKKKKHKHKRDEKSDREMGRVPGYSGAGFPDLPDGFGGDSLSRGVISSGGSSSGSNPNSPVG